MKLRILGMLFVLFVLGGLYVLTDDSTSSKPAASITQPTTNDNGLKDLKIN